MLTINLCEFSFERCWYGWIASLTIHRLVNDEADTEYIAFGAPLGTATVQDIPVAHAPANIIGLPLLNKLGLRLDLTSLKPECIVWTWTWRNTTTSPYYDMGSILCTLIKNDGVHTMDMGVHCMNLQNILDGIVHTMDMGSILWTLIKRIRSILWTWGSIVCTCIHTMDMYLTE